MASEDQSPFIGPSESTRLTAQSIMANVDLHTACCALARTYIEDRPVIDGWNRLIDYCRIQQAHADHEIVRALYLNRKNVLIADETIHHGTIDACQIYPRAVAKRCLELDASAVIIVHNHPSGDPAPSKGDIDMTRRIADALKTIDVVLHDHLVVGSSGTTSMKSLGLF